MLYHLELESVDGLRGIKEHCGEQPPEVYTSAVPNPVCINAARNIREYGLVGIIGKSPYATDAVLVIYREVVTEQ